MHPENLFSLQLRIRFYILVHETDQFQKLLRTHQQVCAHHHIQMADHLSRIVTLALKLQEL